MKWPNFVHIKHYWNFYKQIRTRIFVTVSIMQPLLQKHSEAKAAKTHCRLTILSWGTGKPPSTELLLCCVVCVKLSSVGETGEWWCHTLWFWRYVFQWWWNVTVVYNWTLGLVTREQNTKLVTLIVMLVLLDWDWGVGRSKPTPQTNIFSHQCGGRLQPVGGLNLPNPPTNRTLISCTNVNAVTTEMYISTVWYWDRVV